MTRFTRSGFASARSGFRRTAAKSSSIAVGVASRTSGLSVGGGRTTVPVRSSCAPLR